MRISVGSLPWCAVVLLATAVGCGNKLDVAKVEGVITLDGKPLELIHVEFWPESGPRSFGKTDAEGKFVLQTDDRTQEGAVPGKHRVALRDTWPTKDDYINDGGEWVDMSKGKKSRIHSKYYDPPQTPLTVDVKPGEVNSFTFEVEPRK